MYARKRGFSFMEVLVCLALISGSTLLLLKPQAALRRTFQSIQAEMDARITQDNTHERGV